MRNFNHDIRILIRIISSLVNMLDNLLVSFFSKFCKISRVKFIKPSTTLKFMKHLIIHRHCIDIDLRGNDLKPKQRRKLLSATRVINDLLDDERAQVKDWNFGPETLVDRFYDPGDEVTLYGAYAGVCLSAARRVLEDKGVHVQYHDLGCINLY